MASQSGIVKIVVGTVSATLPDGSTRQLRVGDQVFADERITTASASAIEIELTDGSILDLGQNDQIALADVAAVHAASSETDISPDAEVDAIQQAIAEGIDPTQEAEATAAGAEAGGDGNEGADIVQIDYLAPETTPTSGFDTTGVAVDFQVLEEVLLLNQPITPENVIASVSEAGLPGIGSSARQDSEITSGQLDTSLFSNFTLVNGEGLNGTLTLDSRGNYTYTLTSPTIDLNGVESNTFTYTALDPNGNTVTGTIVIEIIDDVPTAIEDAKEITEGALLSVDADNGILSNDIFGADGPSNKVVTGVAAGAATPVPDNIGNEIIGQYGTLTLAADGSYDYKANADVTTQDVTDIFTYNITDGDGDVSTTTLTINLDDVTLIPVNAKAIADEAGIDTADTVSGTLNVVGAIGYAFSPGTNGSGNNGTLTLNNNGSYTYELTSPVTDGTPGSDGTNTVQDVESFTYTATDANGNTTTGTITVDVIDDVPVAVADASSVIEGAILTVDVNNGVLANDDFGADAPGTRSVTGVVAGTGSPDANNLNNEITGQFGTLTLNENGSYSYVTTANTIAADAQDIFTYTITDNDGDISTTTLTINVDDVTLAPVNPTAIVNEVGLNTVGNTTEIASGQLNVNGAVNYVFSAGVDGNGSNGNLVLNTDGRYTYTLTTPVTDTTPGSDGTNTINDVESFNYTATDALGNTTTGTITVDVIDDVPVARSNRGNVTEGATLTVEADNGVLANDNFGADSPNQQVVTGVIAGRGTPISGNIDSVINGRFGTLTLAEDGSYVYEANPDSTTRNVNDIFTYSITDGDGDISTARLTIRISDTTLTSENVTEDVNEVGLNDASNMSEFATGTLSVAGAIGYSLNGQATAIGNKGTLTINDDGSYSYELTSSVTDQVNDNNTANRVNGVETFTYTATDVNGNTATGTITINVIDDLPFAVADTDSVTEGAFLSVSADNGVLANDDFGADIPATSVVSSVAAGPGVLLEANIGNAIQGDFGTLLLNSDGSYEYNADPDVINGAAKDTFTYRITDADGDTSTTTLTIDVGNVTLSAASPSTTLLEAGLPAGSAPSVSSTTFTGTLNVTDAETYILSGNPTSNANGDLELIGSNGTLTFNASTGAYTYVLTQTITDNANQTPGDNNTANVVNGVDSFSYTAVDADGNTAVGSISINVIDDVPVATIDIYDGSVDEGDNITVDASNGVLSNDTFGADVSGNNVVSGVIAGTGIPTGNVGSAIEGAYGFLQLNADGSYVYEASKTQNITGDAKEVFTYTITDNDGDSSSTTLTINVNDVPPAGPGNGSSVTVFEAGLATGSDPGSSVTAGGQITSAPGTFATAYTIEGTLGNTIQGLYGTLTLNPNGSYTYTLTQPVTDNDPNNTANAVYGAETFNYNAIDVLTGQAITGTININVVDDVPVATADVYDGSVEEGDAIAVSAQDGILGNDTFGADGPATKVVTSVAAGTNTPQVGNIGNQITGAYGVLTLNSDGSYTYDSTEDTVSGTGKDVFTYTITDGDGDTATTTLTIDVRDVTLVAPSPPITVAESDLPGAAPVQGTLNAPAGASYILNGATVNANGDLELIGANGTLTLNSTTGAYTYILNNPVTDGVNDKNTANLVSGAESFSYTLTDANGNTAIGAISINVIDDVPVATADVYAQTVIEGEFIVDVTNGVLANDNFGADVIATGNVVSGVIAGTGTGAPLPGNVGTGIQGAYGTLTLNDDGSYSYQAISDQVTGDGKDIFTYTITDNDGDTSTTTLTINLNDVTLLPDDVEATANEVSLATGDTVTGIFAVDDATGYNLGPGATATANGFELVGNNGILSVNSTTGEYIYTLTTPVTDGTGNNGRNTVDGVEVFTYTATDDNGNSVQSTLTIDVIDDVPLARADTDNVTEGALLSVTDEFGVLANDDSGADAPTTVTGVVAGTGNPGNANIGTGIAGQYGTLTLAANGSYEYQANANAITANASDTFTYRITDADGDVSTTTLTINVADGLPVAVADVNAEALAALQGDILSVDAANGVLANDDFGADIPITELVSGVAAGTGNPVAGNIGNAIEGAYGTLTLNGDGSYDYTKSADATTNTTDATDTFTYSITDSDGDISNTTLTFNIADEVIVGDGGDNTLTGGTGNDILAGAAGSDILTGGGGNDLFIWHNGDEATVAAPHNDTVADFTVGEDTLDLSDLLQGESYTLVGGEFTDGNLLNYLDIAQNGNDTVITIKPDGGSDATQIITLQNTAIPLGGSQAEMLGSLLADGSLVVDQN